MDWNSVVKDLSPKLWRYFCFRFDPEMSRELVQEVLLRLVRSVAESKFQPDRANLATFAYGVARNVSLEAMKARRRSFDQEVDAESLQPRADEMLSAAQESELLRRAIGTLSENEAQILNLMIDKYLSLSEIADISQMPLGTVKNHIFRAKQKIKDCFKAWRFYDEG
ncbi:MAG: RNA polymerase sigma factor [Oligoflexales bacterium]